MSAANDGKVPSPGEAAVRELSSDGDKDAQVLQGLGYEQQLNVCARPSATRGISRLTSSSEELRFRVDTRPNCHRDGDMGSLLCRLCVGADEWRSGIQLGIVWSTYRRQLMTSLQVALVYGFIFCFIGTLATCVSLAEYASMSDLAIPRSF